MAWFDVTTQQAGNQLTVNVTQNNPSGVIYGCKLEVAVNGKRATVDFGVAPTTDPASATITFTGAPSPIVVDPDHRVVNRVGAAFAPPVKPKVWNLLMGPGALREAEGRVRAFVRGKRHGVCSAEHAVLRDKSRDFIGLTGGPRGHGG